MKKSYGYTGKGTATYPNGDIYDGYFVNGVRITFIFFINFAIIMMECLIFEYRLERVKRELTSSTIRTPLRNSKTSIVEVGLITKRMALAR